MTDEQVDEMIFDMIKFFDSFYFYEISKEMMDLVTNKETQAFHVQTAKIALFFKEYDQVIDITNKIVEEDKNCIEALKMRGDAYYFKDNLFDSEENYTAVLRKMDRDTPYDDTMLYRLGKTYVRRKTWSDAKTVFTRILRKNSSFAFAWRNLGLSYMRLEEYTKAEEALNEANLLDIDNSNNWGYLTVFCLLNNRVPQALECYNELNKIEFSNKDLVLEIAEEFFKKGVFVNRTERNESEHFRPNP